MTGIAPRPDPAPLPVAATIGGMQVSDMAVSRAVATRAEIEARYQLALLRPRDMVAARTKLLALCENPDFAAEALYRKPVGKRDVVGLSIRFVEAALQCLTNVFINSTIIAEDEEARIIRITATDLESNLTHATDVTIAKTVERSRIDAGRRVIGERINSRGRRTFLIAATEDEILLKANNLTSKAIRNAGLRLIPASILAEAERLVAKGAKTAAARPDAVVRMADAFAALGVGRQQLEGYLERPLDKATPDQIADLRQVYQAIVDGEMTWADLQSELTTPPAAEVEQAKAPLADAREPYGEATPRASGVIPPRGEADALGAAIVAGLREGEAEVRQPPPASPTPTEDITAAQPELSGLPPSPVRRRGKSNYEEGA